MSDSVNDELEQLLDEWIESIMKDIEAQNAITGGALERLIHVLEEQNKILRDQCEQVERAGDTLDEVVNALDMLGEALRDSLANLIP